MWGQECEDKGLEVGEEGELENLNVEQVEVDGTGSEVKGEGNGRHIAVD